jgi:hypothetical protein
MSYISKVFVDKRVNQVKKKNSESSNTFLEMDSLREREREKKNKKYFAIEICWERRIKKVVIRSHVIREMLPTVQSRTKNQFYIKR